MITYEDLQRFCEANNCSLALQESAEVANAASAGTPMKIIYEDSTVTENVIEIVQNWIDTQ